MSPLRGTRPRSRPISCSTTSRRRRPMPDSRLIPDLLNALRDGYPPSILGWTRVEARPRTHDFDRALRAEVRDALWFLTRQWQMGEFDADDAGLPIRTRMRVRKAPLTEYGARSASPAPFDPTLPLEAQ